MNVDRWREHLKFDPLPALLACGNEALRYFVRRDLLGERVGAVDPLWESPEARRILKKQQPDGAWHRAGGEKHPAINYRLIGTWRHFRFLVEQYGFTREHPQAQRAAEFLFSCQTSAGDFRGFLANQYATYYSGAIMALLNKAGYEDDPRIERGFQWLLSMRQNDQGWTIPLLTHKLDRATLYRVTSEFAEPLEPDRSKPFSHNWTGMVLRAFAAQLVVGNSLLLNTKASGVALDKMTGKTVWASKGMAGLSSPAPFMQDGKLRVFFRSPGVAFAVDPADGKVLWSWRGLHGYDCSDPMLLGNHVLVCGCYAKHSHLLPMTGLANDKEPPKPIWSSAELLSHVATPILYQDYLYTPSGYLGDSRLACFDPKDGSMKWKEKTRVEGLIMAEGKIIAQGPSGTVYVAEASADGYKPRGSYKALTSDECWTSPSLSGGRLYVRSWEGELVGLDLRSAGQTPGAAAASGAGGPAPATETPVPPPSAEERSKPSPAAPAPTPASTLPPPPPKSAAVAAVADWPCWRGIRGDSSSASVPASLPAQATPRWRGPLAGAAYGGVVVSGGCIVVLDHQKERRDEKDENDDKDKIRTDKDIVLCLKADNGVEVWRHTYANVGKAMDFGSCPRATPVIQDGVVCTLSARGQLYALDLQKGAVLWQKDLAKDFRATVPNWGYSSSLLVAGGRLIVNPGSPRDSVVALELETGQTAWSAPGAAANYGTFLLAKTGGMEQLIGYDQEEVWGRSPRDGSLIWSKALGQTPGYLVPSPLVYEDQLLLCGEQGARLQALGAQGTLPEDWDGQNAGYQIGDSTPARAGEMALAVVAGNGLTALELNKGLKVLWSTGEKGMNCAFGSVICGGSRALVLDAAGTLFLFEVQRSGARLLGKLKVCGETRAAPALAGGRLYVRDEKAVYCYELAGR